MYNELRRTLQQLFDPNYKKEQIEQCIFYLSLIELHHLVAVYHEFYRLLNSTILMDHLIGNYIKIAGVNYSLHMQPDVANWLSKRINKYLDNI
jgi:phosphatidylserine decarboxylase